MDETHEDPPHDDRRPGEHRLTDASSASANTPKASASVSSSASSAPPSSSTQGSDVTSAASSKKKRGLGVVTPNACTECRKKRAKVPHGLVNP